MSMLDKLKNNENLNRFIQTTQERIVNSEMGNTSVVVAYYLLLSLFPLLIAVGNLLPYLQINPNSVLPYISEFIPETIFNDLKPAIKSLLTQSSGGLLSVSALATLWSASQSINALQVAMNKAFGVEQRKNFILVRLVSLFVIALLMVALVGVVLILGLGQNILDYIEPIIHIPADFLNTFQTLKWPVTGFGLFLTMSLLYFAVPNVKLKSRSVFPGAIFATIGWLLLSQVFGVYITYFSSRVSGYQIIGSFIVLMLWLNFASTIIVLGGIINAVVEDYLSEGQIESREGMIRQLIIFIKTKVAK
ncbi:YihY/virulence factor BrkB family protein [Enterococcus sp. BWB1-3]|uniref:YihY/virulence factor BrkB family protein n=1 Tax=unclassified Enterococcus TaxID=2608891 RepID=UPI0019217231|nr:MULTISPECIES: YihY/virulence factor BrkB family protein [unclassified Enterococcus]MBL1230768.1 YihY/virulence factor BrkB family protein [Enterococcus sp. BWB1-3]MCB5953227.1 YihY/virulence factor BrkB family protein [Enterococcus sp. BWT-B8]MCB5956225.1 YihY/virulence factor BrkB family protein [Enterococcus sp. CWB-B31]